ncbi:MAG: hypothetical protein D4R74_07970 [Betaproteobacteria bacterium]|nr:MAG: hypothetical protein D4R74_07970 [Betaproteobacteria bacterium]
MRGLKRELPRILAAVFVACLSIAARAAPVAIAPDAEIVAVWPGLRIVAPADRRLAPVRAAELAAGADATQVDSPDRVLGRGTTPHWALFSLYNPGTAEQLRLLALEMTTQFDVRLFRRDDDGAWHQVQSVADNAAGRVGGGTTHPVWALNMAPHQTAGLLLRVEGPAVVRFPLFAYQPVRYTELKRGTFLALGAALGGCLFIGIYIGSMRRYLDDRSVPLFLCMLAADLVGALWLSGFLSALFPAVPENILSLIGFGAYAVLFGCGSLHARIYLNSAAWAPKVDRLLQLLAWFWLGLAPWFSLAFPVAARILLVWGGTAVALALVGVAIAATRRKVPLSGFIAGAWLAYLLVGSYFLVARLIDNPSLWSPSGLALTQAIVVAMLFGFAMLQRMMRQRDALVSARQEALMQREQAATLMRERSLLFAATNHDLRQPLLGVGVFAHLLASAHTPAERDEHAHKLSLALTEVDDLLVSIQQLAAVHEASNQPAFETVKLDDLLAPVIEEYRARSEDKKITIRYVPTRLTITTHVPYFQRIVRNLLSNAVRYTDRGDRILVGCRRAGGLRLIVADTGRGMSEEQTRRAFDAFQRFDASASIPDGFGLGLFSTRSLAHALGLNVSLHSREGRGTEFSIAISAFTQRAVDAQPEPTLNG